MNYNPLQPFMRRSAGPCDPDFDSETPGVIHAVESALGQIRTLRENLNQHRLYLAEVVVDREIGLGATYAAHETEYDFPPVCNLHVQRAGIINLYSGLKPAGELGMGPRLAVGQKPPHIGADPQ